MTAVRVPEGIDGDALRVAMRDRHGIVVAGGQGQLKGRILRFGAFGAIEPMDLVAGVAALEARARPRGPPARARQRRRRAPRSARGGGMSRPRVLVAERIAESGVERLRAVADVDVAVGLERAELLERLPGYDALVVRSATRVDAEALAAGTRLRVVGRAGTGVDNVDVSAATARGILVLNAPQANTLSAAEHAVALMLALARRIPQAHGALVAGRWERSRFSGTELADKTLAILGFGRIGQLVGQRARAFNMRVVAYDPFVAPERFRERGAEHAATIEEAVAQADWISLHLPATPETRGVIGDHLLGLVKPGARLVNAARGDLVDEAALVRALEGGRLAGAALDVFREEPCTESPLFGREDVVVTPHLGASTAEAQDRAGTVVADEVARALAGGLVENAVNVPSVSPEDRAAVQPYVPLAEDLGRIAVALAEGPVGRLHVTYEGAVGDRATELLTRAVLRGALAATDDGVNLVNAYRLAESRGIDVQETRQRACDYAGLVRVAAGGAEVAGTLIGGRLWLVGARSATRSRSSSAARCCSC